MNIQRSTLACATALAASMSATYAGPCSPEIIRVQEIIDADIHAKARTVTAPESRAAKAHRQPTPGSIAAAEVELGQISPQLRDAVKAAIARALKADGAGDRSTCEQALADVKRLLRSAGIQTDDARR
jgi:hypothetical protein